LSLVLIGPATKGGTNEEVEHVENACCRVLYLGLDENGALVWAGSLETVLPCGEYDWLHVVVVMGGAGLGRLRGGRRPLLGHSHHHRVNYHYLQNRTNLRHELEPPTVPEDRSKAWLSRTNGKLAWLTSFHGTLTT